MELTDIMIRSHIVAEGKLDDKQLTEVMKILEENPQFEDVLDVLKTNGIEVFHKHSNDLEISRFNSTLVKEDDEDFLKALEELVDQFKE